MRDGVAFHHLIQKKGVAFHHPPASLLFMGRACGAPKGAPGPFCRSANPQALALHLGGWNEVNNLRMETSYVYPFRFLIRERSSPCARHA